MTPDFSLATFIFRAAPNASDSHTSSFRAFHCVHAARRTQPQKGENQGVLPHSCALAQDLFPSAASTELFCRSSSGSSPFRAVQLSDAAAFIQPFLADCAAEGYLTSTICSLLTKHSQANNPVPI